MTENHELIPNLLQTECFKLLPSQKKNFLLRHRNQHGGCLHLIPSSVSKLEYKLFRVDLYVPASEGNMDQDIRGKRKASVTIRHNRGLNGPGGK